MNVTIEIHSSRFIKFDGLIALLENSKADAIDLKIEDTNLVLGALFMSVVKADGRIRPEETEFYNHLVDNVLKICEDERIAFEDGVEAHLANPKGVSRLVDLLKGLPLEKRREIILHMRDISISDSEYHEIELNLIAKVGQMLGLDGGLGL